MAEIVCDSDGDAASRLHAVLAELQRREPIFHRREYGITRTDFERVTDAGFWETGASGRRYSREHVWSVLVGRYKSDPSGRLDPEWDQRIRATGNFPGYLSADLHIAARRQAHPQHRTVATARR